MDEPGRQASTLRMAPAWTWLLWRARLGQDRVQRMESALDKSALGAVAGGGGGGRAGAGG